ncbi:unnamed protein product [Linum tenue]|uniref:Uncharacterized protein n=1 Tax=Linum tenue TaxID=586396 RepID=A0AAV0H388_9ROSI|nr:unnamed protein product [Linum tenue]
MIEPRAPRDNKFFSPKVKAPIDAQPGHMMQLKCQLLNLHQLEGLVHKESTECSHQPAVCRKLKNSCVPLLQPSHLPRLMSLTRNKAISLWNCVETQNKAPKQAELNLPPSNYQNNGEFGDGKQLPKSSEMSSSKVWEVRSRTQSSQPRLVPTRIESPKPRDMSRRTESPKPWDVPPRTENPKPRKVSRTEASMQQSLPSKQLDNYTHVPPGVPNGRNTGSNLVNGSRSETASSDGFGQMGYRGGPHYPPQAPGQVLTDPVEAMRISAAERAQKPTSAGQSSTAKALPTSRSDCSNAATTVA